MDNRSGSPWVLKVPEAPVVKSVQIVVADPDPPKCDHPETEVRCDRRPTTGPRYVRQCVNCGKWMEAVAKAKVASFQGMKDFDTELEKRWRDRVSTFWQQRRDADLAATAAQSAEWWRRYDAYLLTPKWAAIREKVLKRDQYRCQGCLGASAVQVHHLTYDNVGDELLFQLISVCMGCHQRCHPDRRF